MNVIQYFPVQSTSVPNHPGFTAHNKMIQLIQHVAKCLINTPR